MPSPITTRLGHLLLALAVIIAATVNVAAHINRPAASSALAAVWR